MDTHYDTDNKKKLIAILLFVACALCGVLLIYSPGSSAEQLQNFTQADSLILNTMHQFDINQSQIHVYEHPVDSNLIRKTFSVKVPPDFSKTHLHAELNRLFNPLAVRTPAKISLPEGNMVIQLVWNQTVIRTISLNSDTDLVLDRDWASILVAFKEAPSQSLLNEIIRLGAPIPVVLQISDTEKAHKEAADIEQRYSRICFWIDPPKNLASENNQKQPSLPNISVLDKLQKGSTVVVFRNKTSIPPKTLSSFSKIAFQKQLTFIDADNALILNSNLGETLFKERLNNFSAEAKQGNRPVAIVMGNATTLKWLSEKLAELKKGGLYLVQPPKLAF